MEIERNKTNMVHRDRDGKEWEQGMEEKDARRNGKEGSKARKADTKRRGKGPEGKKKDSSKIPHWSNYTKYFYTFVRTIH